MNTPSAPRWDRQMALVGGVAACLSVASFLHYFQRAEILLYGDAVAHINIARKVFDSRTPGLLQLGTVWLPLPHLLMLPFLLSNWMWRTGVGGSIPSMIAYVLGAIGIFRLTRDELRTTTYSNLAPWIAVITYAANPNLIYLQSTAMTEPLYLALFIWAVLYFLEFIKSTPRSSTIAVKSGLCLLGACLTRYDGWLLAVVICGALVVVVFKENSSSLKRHHVMAALLLAAGGPILWLLYNTAVYRNPLEFANGPYSAKAIEKKTSAPGTPPHPGTANPVLGAQYVLKSAELNMAKPEWLQRLWLSLAIVGSMLCLSRMASVWPLLLLWIPIIFYALSIGYGGVPLFMPTWWPFSYYNVRYGLQLLPALAVFSAFSIHFIAVKLPNTNRQAVFLIATFAVLAVSYSFVFRDPVCFREAWINSRTRIALENELAAHLHDLPPSSTILMYLGDHVGALQQAAIPLRRLIHEGNHRVWKQPYDPDGLWERALANPKKYVDYVIAVDHDAVSTAVNNIDLTSLKVIDVPGQPQAIIYATHATGH